MPGEIAEDLQIVCTHSSIVSDCGVWNPEKALHSQSNAERNQLSLCSEYVAVYVSPVWNRSIRVEASSGRLPPISEPMKSRPTRRTT